MRTPSYSGDTASPSSSAFTTYCNAFAAAVTGGIVNDTSLVPTNAEAKALGARHGYFSRCALGETTLCSRQEFERLIAERYEVNEERNERLTAFAQRLTTVLEKSEASEVVCFLEADEARLLVADIAALAA